MPFPCRALLKNSQKDGELLGYGGISNSLAVEFAWTNVDTQQSDDVFHFQVSGSHLDIV